MAYRLLVALALLMALLFGATDSVVEYYKTGWYPGILHHVVWRIFDVSADFIEAIFAIIIFANGVIYVAKGKSSNAFADLFNDNTGIIVTLLVFIMTFIHRAAAIYVK